MLNAKFSDIVVDFIEFTNDDIRDSLSNNVLNQRLWHIKKAVENVSCELEHDKTVVKRVRKSVKVVHKSGMVQQQCEIDLANLLAELGDSAVRCGVDSVGSALSRFSTVYCELAALLRNLMQSLSNVVFSPLDTFVKAELKVDQRKGFDKALREYEARTEKLRKERQHAARESKVEASSAETTDSLERERRLLQLQLCEFFITTTDVKAKKQSSLVQYLSDYYAAQLTYFKESLAALEELGARMRGMADSLEAVRTDQDQERRSLVKLRDELRAALSDRDGGGSNIATMSAYSLHQSQGNPAHGTVKAGYLLKRSGSKVKKVWQKRRAAVDNGCFLLYHADNNRPPVSLPLLTCQVRHAASSGGDKPASNRRGTFSLVSNNRTYSFQCESPQEADHWVSVLCNAKAGVFQAAMGAGGDCRGPTSPDAIDSAASVNYPQQAAQGAVRATVMREVRTLPGNEACADCSAADPEWISINLGVLICLECCGIHRDLGVHVSRTQSLLMDDLTPAQLLISRCLGNAAFNEVFEAVLPEGVKPGSSAGWRLADLQQQMSQRKAFIRAKYLDRSYVCRTTPAGDPAGAADSLARDLAGAVRHLRLPLLLQTFAEGCDLLAPRPEADNETALHAMLRGELRDQSNEEGDVGDLRRLAVVEFALQNSPQAAQRRATATGRETLLHYCVRFDRPEYLRVCLRAPGLATTAGTAVNRDGLTAAALCQRMGGRAACAHILHSVEVGDTSVLDNPGGGGGGGRGQGASHTLTVLTVGEASYPDLSLCSEEELGDDDDVYAASFSAAASRAESPSGRLSSGGSSGAAPSSSFFPEPTKAIKARAQAPPRPPPLPPLPRHRRPSSGFDSCDSVQIVIEAALEGLTTAAASDASCYQKPPPLAPKPKPQLKPKPKLTRASMPAMQLQQLAAAAMADVAADAAAPAAAAAATTSSEEPPLPQSSTSF